MSNEYKSPFLENRERLFENEIGFVIYDGYPVSTGHCLIIPKRVYPDYFDSTLEELKGLNHEYIVSLVGIKGEMRIDEDLCTVSELLASRSSYQGKLSLKGRRLKKFLTYCGIFHTVTLIAQIYKL